MSTNGIISYLISVEHLSLFIWINIDGTNCHASSFFFISRQSYYETQLTVGRRKISIRYKICLILKCSRSRDNPPRCKTTIFRSHRRVSRVLLAAQMLLVHVDIRSLSGNISANHTVNEVSKVHVAVNVECYIITIIYAKPSDDTNHTSVLNQQYTQDVCTMKSCCDVTSL